MALAVTDVRVENCGSLNCRIITGTVASGDTTGNIVTGFTGIIFAVVVGIDYDMAVSALDWTTTAGTLTPTFANPGATKNFKAFVLGY